MDHTTIHPSSVDQAYRVDLHLWRGAPQNLDAVRPIQVLVNQGYVVGFCPSRLQPAWSAYRVANADADVDYDRPLTYYDDLRLPEDLRIGRTTFGKLGNIQLNVGHMTPNEVINRQFGRLAQLETFLMSNMSPQYASLNQGVWLKLETAIREIEDDSSKDHVWAIVGPVFGPQPVTVDRGNGKHLPIPDKYFCVIVDPHTYPYDTPSRVDIDCFIIPQDAPRDSLPDDYPATLAEVQDATNLELFASWARDLPHGVVAAVDEQAPPSESRLMTVLQAKRAEEEAARDAEADGDEANTIEGLVEELEREAAQIQIQGRALTDEELARVRMIQFAISWLIRARDIVNPPVEPEEPVEPPPPPTLITYVITDDMGGLLRQGARTACNFWNRFVEPSQAIVIRLGLFTENSNTIARAYRPYEQGGTRYGRVEFNTKYLAIFTAAEIAGTITHEIGHSLGIGWDRWDELFSPATGLFSQDAIDELDTLESMEVERDGGAGTALSHWDEARFDRELMTGFQDQGEHVLPVTIGLMRVLGHTVTDHLTAQTPLADLLQHAASVVFSRQSEIQLLNLEYFEETDLFETIPHPNNEDD